MRNHIDRRPTMSALMLLGLVTAWLLLRALAAPLNHDESQYVAAAVLSRDHMIFRDFLSLQPPLYAWIGAPLAWAFDNDVFVALRLTNAVVGIVTLGLVFATSRVMGASTAAALGAVLLMVSCEPFLFAAAVARNDIFPAALFAGAILAGLIAIRKGRIPLWLLVGMLLGLAASTKLSFAPPLACAGLFACRYLLARPRNWWPPIGVAVGALAGLAPMVIAFAGDPEAFLYGTIEYGATAPFDWYRANALDDRLGWPGKVVDFAGYALIGPTLIALMLVIGDRIIAHRAGISDVRRQSLPDAISWLWWMLFAGLAAALMPTPIQKQYLLPILPPLFVLLGLLLDRLGKRGKASAAAFALLGCFALVGLVKAGKPVLWSSSHGFAALVVDRQADWMGDELRRDWPHGTIASLSPERVVDSGFAVDRRLATGPFVFRSGGLVGARRAVSIDAIIPETLSRALDAAPPVAILTGYERSGRPFRIGLDGPLIAYARAHGYRPRALPDGVGTLYIRQRGLRRHR